MNVTFLGTRGYIKAKTRRHRRHTSTLISQDKTKIMLDCGIDWKKKVWEIDPTAIFLTHGHPDHAAGLEEGAPCPVYATEETCQRFLKDYDIKKQKKVYTRKPIRIGTITLEAFDVVHSFRAPAVGYRISAGKKVVWYVPDVVAIPERGEALKKVALYIGDGSTLTRSMVRREGNKLFGHTTIRAQLGWCQEEGVPRAIFTHFGMGIVTGDERKLIPKIRKLGKEKGVEVEVAYDGREVVLF